MAGKDPKYAWLDGEIVPWDNATIHVRTAAVMYGASVFEGCRAYWNEEQGQLYALKLGEHMDRLYDVSIKFMRMTVPWTREELAQACLDLLKACEIRENVHFRPTIYFGKGEYLRYSEEPITSGGFITTIARPPNKQCETGIKVGVSSWARIDDRSFPPRIKLGANYNNSRLAAVEGHMHGYDSAIMLNAAGKIAETYGSCVFLVRKGKVVTPSATDSILESITRQAVIDLFRDEFEIDVVEREVDRTELYSADEVFLCGTGQEILPVNSVDRIPVGKGQPGELTKQMRDLYFDIANGRKPEYARWVTPVYSEQPAMQRV